MPKRIHLFFVVTFLIGTGLAAHGESGRGDWLIDEVGQRAAVETTGREDEIALTNGLIRRTFRLAPGGATVAFDNLMTGESILRGVKPEARITVDGQIIDVGGLSGQPNYAFLTPEWLDELSALPGALQYAGYETGPIEERFAWKQVRHHAPDAVWPPKGVHLRMDYAPAEGDAAPLKVSVHYNLYDGIPLLSKWITVTNAGEKPVRLDAFTSEILACVERGSDVDNRTGVLPHPNLHVETDYAFAGMSALDSSEHSVHWVADPQYETQLNYERLTPCLLEVRPNIGPSVDIAPGETFESFRAFELVHDTEERERKGLAQRRMYRIIAPWVTENPLMMHVRYSSRRDVELALDQCAEARFEMAILTFGSGFDIENRESRYLEQMTRYAEYAHERGVEFGGYSLLASRSIDAENDVVMGPGESPTFGNSPCIGSPWGEGYFEQLYHFFDTTGFNLLEHDGSYPGDTCRSTTHRGHRGYEDSQWTQWTTIRNFYQWCRGEGLYLNVPDYYFLAGSSKTGMGYRETNWSLPRAQQVIHTRQNIYDGTWTKTPSMGWMFVPLTEYHGGGEAATIEPLDEHLDHYEHMLFSNLALGVQACYRGPRLYDTDRTKAMVQRWVAWYKKHRDILESDLVHGRRADGRDLDWMLHVNPTLEEKGMLIVFNPLEEAVQREIPVDVYYTGLDDSVSVTGAEGETNAVAISRDYEAAIPVNVPAQGFAWYVLQ
ncbi:MAG: hypothetical protein GC168_15135 [Candidatus Hydrogenedens sp.]|nr:hypothetical protein [Candidatus Hydrogenedens sp.]